MSSSPPRTPHGAPRVIICDYNALLQSVTGLLRMSGFCVFEAYNGEAANELCRFLPEIDLLVLNTEGTGTDTPRLIKNVREAQPGLPVLHIGKEPLPEMPADVSHIPETFRPAQLLTLVDTLLENRVNSQLV